MTETYRDPEQPIAAAEFLATVTGVGGDAEAVREHYPQLIRSFMGQDTLPLDEPPLAGQPIPLVDRWRLGAGDGNTVRTRGIFGVRLDETGYELTFRSGGDGTRFRLGALDADQAAAIQTYGATYTEVDMVLEGAPGHSSHGAQDEQAQLVGVAGVQRPIAAHEQMIPGQLVPIEGEVVKYQPGIRDPRPKFGRAALLDRSEAPRPTDLHTATSMLVRAADGELVLFYANHFGDIDYEPGINPTVPAHPRVGDTVRLVARHVQDYAEDVPRLEPLVMEVRDPAPPRRTMDLDWQRLISGKLDELRSRGQAELPAQLSDLLATAAYKRQGAIGFNLRPDQKRDIVDKMTAAYANNVWGMPFIVSILGRPAHEASLRQAGNAAAEGLPVFSMTAHEFSQAVEDALVQGGITTSEGVINDRTGATINLATEVLPARDRSVIAHRVWNTVKHAELPPEVVEQRARAALTLVRDVHTVQKAELLRDMLLSDKVRFQELIFMLTNAAEVMAASSERGPDSLELHIFDLYEGTLRQLEQRAKTAAPHERQDSYLVAARDVFVRLAGAYYFATRRSGLL